MMWKTCVSHLRNIREINGNAHNVIIYVTWDVFFDQWERMPEAFVTLMACVTRMNEHS